MKKRNNLSVKLAFIAICLSIFVKADAQKEFRVGLLLTEYGEIAKFDGGHTLCCDHRFQFFNALVVEQQIDKRVHRVELQRDYANNLLSEALVNLKGISLSYDYLYKIGPVYAGGGIHYSYLNQNWDLYANSARTPRMVTSIFHGVGPGVVVEANIPLTKSIYLSPSVLGELLFGTVKSHASKNTHSYVYFAPRFRLTLKKALLKDCVYSVNP